MQFFSAKATIFFIRFNFFCPQKVPDSRVAAKMAQTEEFIFQNVAYRPTVDKTGFFTCKQFLDKSCTNRL